MIRDSKINGILGGILFISLIALYVYTAAPTVFDGDSGELATVIHTLGLAHPTGFPIYILLGKLVTLIGGDPARTLNLLSSFFIVSSAVFLFFIFSSLRINRLVSFLSAIVFALGRSLWYHGGIVAVYPMGVFFITLLLLLFVRWQQEHKTKYIYLYAFIWGLSLGTHSVMLILVIPLLFMLYKGRTQFRGFLSYLKLIGIFLLTSFQYIYLPLAYARNQIVTFGSIKDFGGFFHYITQRDYAFKIGVRGFSDILPFIDHVIGALSTEFGLLFFLIGILGFVFLFKKNLQLFVILVGLFLGNMLMLFFYGGEADLELLYRYLYLDYVVLTICIASGGYWVYEKLAKTPNSRIFIYIVFSLGIMFTFQTNFQYDDRHNNYVGYDFARNVLMTPVEKSIVISEGDAVSGPLWYLQSMGQRPDIILVDANALTLDWYVENMHKRYPDIVDLDLTKLYGTDRDSHKNKRLLAFINKNISSHSIYLAIGAGDPILKIYDLFPVGVVYKVFAKGGMNIEVALAESDKQWKSYTMRGVQKNQYYSPQTNDIIRFYSIMLSNLSAFHYMNHHSDSALTYMEKAVAIDPSYRVAVKNLEVIKKSLNQ